MSSPRSKPPVLRQLTSIRDSQRPVQPDPKRDVRSILRLTWPVVIGQLLANAVPVLDLLMLGRYGTRTLAAVGYASQFLMLMQATLMALGAACVAMMARAIGARDEGRARRAFAANLSLAVLVTSTTLLLTLLYPEAALHLLAADDAVTHLAVPYLRLTMGAAPLMAIALTYESAFRAARDTFRPMLIVGLSALIKVLGNVLLLTGVWGLPKLGLEGAGISTLSAQLVGALCFVAMSRAHRQSAVRLGLRDLWVRFDTFREAFAIAWPAVAERFAMNAATLLYFRFLGSYGVEAIAAYNVGVRILAFTWIPGLGLSVAAATLVGQALGASDADRARRIGAISARLGVMVAITLSALFIGLRGPLSHLFTADPAVIAALDPFILLLGVGLPFLVSHFTLSGALRGAGDTLTPLWAATVGNWVFRVPLGYLCAELLHVELFWVWSIMIVDHVTRALWLNYAFKRGRWHARLGVTTRDMRRAARVADAA